MNDRIRARLELVRIPNVFTAVADIIAAFLYSGGELKRWETWLPLVCASSCLYCGGMALNDVCDARRDAADRPNRPIPSGRVSRRDAFALSVILLAVGVASAFAVSAKAGAIAVLLTVSIGLYDGPLKSTPVAPAVMGLCRALNLALGMSHAFEWHVPSLVAPLVMMWLYVSSVTFFARDESTLGNRGRLSAGTIGACTAVASLAVPGKPVENAHGDVWVPVVGLALLLAYHGTRACLSARPETVQRTVSVFVLSIIGWDACLAWSARGPIGALTVMLLLIPAVGLARLFRVT